MLTIVKLIWIQEQHYFECDLDFFYDSFMGKAFTLVSLTKKVIVLTTHIVLWHIWSQQFSAPPHRFDSSPVFQLIFCSMQPVKQPEGVCRDLQDGCELLHCFLHIIQPRVLSKNSGHSNNCDTSSGLYCPMGSTRHTRAWDWTAEQAEVDSFQNIYCV